MTEAEKEKLTQITASYRKVAAWQQGGQTPYTIGDLRRVMDYARDCLKQAVAPWSQDDAAN